MHDNTAAYIKAYLVFLLVSILLSLGAGLLQGTIFGMVLGLTGTPPQAIMVLAGITGFLIAQIISFFVFRWSVRRFVLGQPLRPTATQDSQSM